MGVWDGWALGILARIPVSLRRLWRSAARTLGLRGAQTLPDRLVGAAANPRVSWHRNPAGTAPRTLREALDLARANGVDISDEAYVVRVSPVPLHDYATYFSLQVKGQAGRTQLIELKLIKTVDDRFGILLSPEVLESESDDQIIAVLAHEVYESRALEREFLANGGRLAVATVYSLVNSSTGTLHCQAWDHADALIRRRHGPEDR